MKMAFLRLLGLLLDMIFAMRTSSPIMTLAQEPMVKLETTVNEVPKIRRSDYVATRNADNKACLEVCLAMLSPSWHSLPGSPAVQA